MQIIEVTELSVPDYPDLADYTDLTDVALRRKLEPERGLYIAESSTVIRRAIAAGHEPKSFLMAPKWVESMAEVVNQFPGVPLYTASEETLEQITGFHLHRGALAVMHRPDPVDVNQLLQSSRRIAVIEDVVDHTNVGAIFRSAAALGVDAVLITPRCADPLYRRAIRVSMGAVFQVPWARFEYWPTAEDVPVRRRGGAPVIGPKNTGIHGIDLLRQHGYQVVAMALGADSVSLDDFAAQLPARFALVLGTEGDGLRPATVAHCDVKVQIPMSGEVDSLNVAAAAAVAFWATRATPSSQPVESQVP